LRNAEPDVFNNLDQYVDLRVTQNYYVWTKDADGNPVPNRIKNRTNLVPCSPPRLLQNGSQDYLGITTKYVCPENRDFYVQGMLSSENAGFIQIAVRECS
jgi:hypothetical protein